ncbi:hypothetical protein O181_013243 [Austropuccinia psidii MF-1]|uniref:Uncharacterized protein n=1 Tax=Austropuccinia psidii MF-1 TaxID=1389203 RepID=A0A9Q3GMX4_9BASI|nr:hypothetical protein [Austropuccinia psidii MF-1]
MSDQHDPSSSQQPNLALMFFTWYPNILFIIESIRKQEYNLKIPKEYDFNSHSECQLFTPASPTSNLTQPLYPAVFSMSSKKKLIQLPSGSDLTIVKSLLLPDEKIGLAFLWIKKSQMGNLPITFGLLHPLDLLLMPGT